MSNGIVAPEVIITRTTVEPIPLPAPDVAVAFHDEDSKGLIPVSELSAPLTVDLNVWAAAEENYTYQLVWDTERTGPEKIISATDKPGDPLTLEIPVDALTEGFHSLAYRTYSPRSETENFSDVFPIIIDRTAPGKPVLAPHSVSSGSAEWLDRSRAGQSRRQARSRYSRLYRDDEARSDQDLLG